MQGFLQNKVVIVGGPTASGKSRLALEICKKIDGVIINADCLQLYKGMPILTAQPPEIVKAKVPHRLYEIYEGTQNTSAASWLQLAQAEIKWCQLHKRVPVFVGGTGLYLKSLVYGISDIPDIEGEIRKRVRTLCQDLFGQAFYEYVKEVDPSIEGKLKPQDRQRLSRALEVKLQTGRSLSEFHGPSSTPSPYDFKILVVMPEREFLYDTINKRFEEMVIQGAIEEVNWFRSMVAQHKDLSPTLAKAIGLRELGNYLDGQCTLEEAISLAQKNTRNYAKRQITWFKHQFKNPIFLTKPAISDIYELLG